MAAPIRSEIKLKQSLGRIFRVAKFKKEPIVVDFIDYNIDLLKNQSYARNRIYKYLEEV
jgi:superfamily II DNA or RNA helicase